MSEKFYIRADGNDKIGMGHVQRCLSLAKALKKKGADPVFLTADDKAAGWIEKAGFPYISLNTDYLEMETELPRLQEILKKDPGPVLVDSYQITKPYMKLLCGLTRTILMSDDKQELYDCHELINYNIYAEDLGYQDAYSRLGYQPALHLGPQFAPLREEFSSLPSTEEVLPEKTENERKKILLTTGGSDGCHLGLLFARKVAEHKMPENAEYHVLCGPFCEDGDALRKLAENCEELVIDGPVYEMASYLRTFDLVVSAAGSTLYELCALGIPTLAFTTADNQKKNLDGFARRSELIALGDAKEDAETVLTRMETDLNRLLGSETAGLREIGDSMRRITDGHGAEKLAIRLLKEQEDIENRNKKAGKEKIVFVVGVILILLGGLSLFGLKNARDKQKSYEDFRNLSPAEERMMDPDPELLIFGDSLLALARDEITIPDRISEKTGLRIFNAAIGGSTAASANDKLDFARHMDALGMWSIKQALVDGDYGVILAENEANPAAMDYFSIVIDRLQEIDLERVKYIMIAYGTNDYAVGHDPYHVEDPEDITSLGCALKLTVEAIREAYPHITVILVTPKYCVINGEDCLTADYGGGVITDYVEAIKAVGAEEQVPVIDGFFDSGINADNIMYYTGGEGLHFSREGVIYYGDFLGEQILKIMAEAE